MPSRDERRPPRSNVLLIMTDQQRFDSLGVTGCRAIRTPNLDRLAAEGVVFDRCYVNNTVCTPSRASIMTGLPLQGHGVFQLHDRLPPDRVLFARRLQERGYRTALIGKLHVSGRLIEAEERHPNDGFDVYEWCMDPTIHLDSPFNAYAGWLQREHPAVWNRLQAEGRGLRHFPQEAHFNHWAADRTIRFLDQQEGKPPFFCFTSLFDPHSPYFDCPRAWLDAVDLDALGPPAARPEPVGSCPRAVELEQARWAATLNGAGPYQDLAEIRRGYYASIACLDHELGRILDHLERTGLKENTTVLFLSDHGDMLGDRGLLTKGPYFYDACARVPMIARFADAAASETGRRYNGLVQPHDVAATVLSAAGWTAAESGRVMPHARDLRGMAAGTVAERDIAVCEYPNSGYGTGGRYYEPGVHATMIHDGTHKMTLHHGSAPDIPGAGELYDMQDDPQEQHNLWTAPEHAETRLRLALRLADWNADMVARYTGGRGGARTPWEEKSDLGAGPAPGVNVQATAD